MLKCWCPWFWSFSCFLTVCQIMSKGVVAVLGPSVSPASNSIISNICGEKEVSAGSFLLYIEVRYSPLCVTEQSFISLPILAFQILSIRDKHHNWHVYTLSCPLLYISLPDITLSISPICSDLALLKMFPTGSFSSWSELIPYRCIAVLNEIPVQNTLLHYCTFVRCQQTQHPEFL